MLLRRAAAVTSLAAFALSCGGGKDTAGTSSTGDEPTSRPSSSAKEELPGTAPQASLGKLPDQVDDLGKAIPEDASLVVTLPTPATLELPKELTDLALASAGEEVAKRLGISVDTLKAVVEAFDGAALFDLADLDQKEPPVAVIARFKDGKAAESLIQELKLQKTGDVTYVLEKDGKKLYLAWLPSAKTAIASPREDALKAALDTLSGARKPFAGSARAKGSDPTRLFALADLHKLLPKKEDVAAEGSQLMLSLGLKQADIALTELGPKVPRIGTVLAPIDHAAIEKLPEGAAFAIDLSLARRPGKTLKDLFLELGRPSGADFTPSIESTLKPLDLSIADVDRALGDSLTIAIYPDLSAKPTPESLVTGSAVLFTLGVKDEKIIKTLFDTAKKVLGTKAKGVEWSEGKVVALVEGKTLIVQVSKDAIVGSYGDKSTGEKLIKSFLQGSAPLGKTPAFASYKSAATPSQLSFYVDFDTLTKALPKDGTVKMPVSGVTASDVVLADTDKGIDLVAKGGGVAPIIGALAGVAVYGVRRYLASAKSAEAKNTVGAIARAAVASYERERADPSGKLVHALCKSAPAAPVAVPKGAKSDPSKDFETGTDEVGWKCLKFTVTTPVYYQYEYRAGGKYKCTSRGGDDPGPDGFEASAEGDLNGDGKTSLFCITGKVQGGAVKISTHLTIADEFE